nr:hypothetical protein [Deltaproteobacteria bacterium]
MKIKSVHGLVAAGVIASLSLTDCATTGARRPRGAGARARVGGTQFPSRAELARLSATPAPRAPATPTAPLERWELAGPFPEAVGSVPSQDPAPLAALLRARAERTGGRAVVTEAMQCAARELGRYLLRHEGATPQPISDFVLGRCGALGSRVSSVTSDGTEAATSSDADVVHHFETALGGQVDQLLDLAPGPINVGAALVRDGDRFVTYTVSEQRVVALEPGPLTPDANGDVTLAGRLLTTTAGLGGYINQGTWSSATCTMDPAVRLPAFRARCPMRPGDTVARVELSAHAPGRLLGHSVLSAIVGSGRAASRTFELAPDDPAQAARDPQQAQGVALALLNDARRAAGAPAVTLAAQESSDACQLAPAYFANATDNATAGDNDRIALGLIAGWSVEGGLIRAGHFFGTAGTVDSSLQRWISWTLERPMGRQVLMAPEVRQVSLCPAMIDGRVAGILWSSYSFYDDAELNAEAERVYRRIDAQRAATRLPPAQRMASLQPTMAATAASVVRGGDLEESLQAMLNRASEATGGGAVRGWVIPTIDIDTIEFPEVLVTTASASAAVHVVHRRDQGAAWGQSVVFVLMR